MPSSSKILRLTLPESASGLALDDSQPALWIDSDRLPNLVMLERDADGVMIRHQELPSGTLHLVGSIEGIGKTVLQTSILMLRSEPYRLSTELVRGQANKLRNFLAECEREGWQPPSDLAPMVRDLGAKLCQTIHGTDPASDRRACELLADQIRMGDELVCRYARDRWLQPTNGSTRPSLGVHVRGWPRRIERSALQPVQTCSLALDWKQLELEDGTYDWKVLERQLTRAINLGLEPTIGPILDFSTGGVPEWIKSWESDPATLVTLLVDLIETVVGRFSDRVRHWIVASGTNSTTMLRLSESRREWLTARLLEAAQRIQPEGTFAIGIDEPWGWYAGRDVERCWPVDFVDALIRIGARPGALQLDARCGSFPRSCLDLVKLVDRYRRLGLPIWLELGTSQQSGDTDRSASDRALRWLLAGGARPNVERINWSTLIQGDLAGGPVGLVDAAGKPTALIDRLQELAQRATSASA